VLHVADDASLELALSVLDGRAAGFDVFALAPVALSTGRPDVEVLTAESAAGGWLGFAALIASGRLDGYRLVVRHVQHEPDDVERLRRLMGSRDAEALTRMVHADLDTLGLYVEDRELSGRPTIKTRASEITKRSAVRVASTKAAGTADLRTFGLRGAMALAFGTLQWRQQDFESPATDEAELAIEGAYRAFLASSGMRFVAVDDVGGAEVRVLSRRAAAWAVYHPGLTAADSEKLGDWARLRALEPRFDGHQLPVSPTTLGFANALVPGDRARQRALAVEHGVEGFLVRTRWNSRGLAADRFFDALEPNEDFPFAVLLDHSATEREGALGSGPKRRRWNDPGPEQYERLAERIAELAAHPAYLRVDDRPVLVVEDRAALTDSNALVAAVRSAVSARLGLETWIADVDAAAIVRRQERLADPSPFDALVQLPPDQENRDITEKLPRRFEDRPARAIDLAERYTMVNPLADARRYESLIPGAMVGWDSTPTLGAQGIVGIGWSAMWFRRMLEDAVRAVAARPIEHRIVIVNSWNGWAELSQLEPSSQRGTAYLALLADALGVS
jgi:hypothetical protein